MDEYIINSFTFSKYNTFSNIFNYIKSHSTMEINKEQLKKQLKYLIKKKTLDFINDSYKLTEKGNAVLSINVYYYKQIIYNFLSKLYINRKQFKKSYELKEKRNEQQMLRKHLIENKEHICILCSKKLPLCLLQTAHLKPRCIISDINELYDTHLVEFMCMYCHALYDSGHIGVHNGKLLVSKDLNNYDIKYENNNIDAYTIYNSPYFEYHYKSIFLLN
jgi:hypothetical protein